MTGGGSYTLAGRMSIKPKKQNAIFRKPYSK
jgi:hypothetical protein